VGGPAQAFPVVSPSEINFDDRIDSSNIWPLIGFMVAVSWFTIVGRAIRLAMSRMALQRNIQRLFQARLRLLFVWKAWFDLIGRSKVSTQSALEINQSSFWNKKWNQVWLLRRGRSFPERLCLINRVHLGDTWYVSRPRQRCFREMQT